MVLSAMRRVFSKCHIAREVEKKALVREKGPRGGARYLCAVCLQPFGSREIHRDHIEPVIPVGRHAKDMTWDEIYHRIFCSVDNIQVICVKCHKIKSKDEAKLRKKVAK